MDVLPSAKAQALHACVACMCNGKVDPQMWSLRTTTVMNKGHLNPLSLVVDPGSLTNAWQAHEIKFTSSAPQAG
jgi:hypothetical protein